MRSMPCGPNVPQSPIHTDARHGMAHCPSPINPELLPKHGDGRLGLWRIACLTYLLHSLLPHARPAPAGAQTFVPVPSPAINHVLVPPGYFVLPGQSTTSYFQGHSGTLSGGSGLTGLGAYDALAWFLADLTHPQLGLPPGWLDLGGRMGSCDPNYGDSWYIYIPIPGIPVAVDERGGTHCWPPSPYNPLYILAAHMVGQPNPPSIPPTLPDDEPVACPNSCGGT